MGRNWNSAWEKVLSALLTANIAMMGWLWANIARLADRLDKHVEDRVIHREIDAGAFVARREFEAWRDSEAAAEKRLEEGLDKLEGKLDKAIDGRGRSAS